jgi:hypothetical protein
LSLGYFSNNRFAHSWTFSINFKSDNISIGISVCHACIVPRISQGQRFFRSSSASLNQSFVSSIAFNLL